MPDLGYSIDNAMADLGAIGRTKGRELLEAVADELGEIMDFIGAEDA